MKNHKLKLKLILEFNTIIISLINLFSILRIVIDTQLIHNLYIFAYLGCCYAELYLNILYLNKYSYL